MPPNKMESFDLQEVTSICSRRVNQAIEVMEEDEEGQVIGSGVLAKVSWEFWPRLAGSSGQG